MEMSANERAFWLWRCQEISVAGIFSAEGSSIPETADFNVSMSGQTPLIPAVDEVEAYYSGHFDIGYSPSVTGSEILIIVGTFGDLAAPQFPGETNGDLVWLPFFSLEITYRAPDGSVAAVVTTDSGDGSRDTSDFSVTVTGADIVTGGAYLHTVQMYKGSTLNLTGSLTITPASFWPFSDDSGTALYDTATGALIS